MPVAPNSSEATPPAWLALPTCQAIAAAAAQAERLGQDAYAAALAVAHGHHPALPLPMLGEAVACVLALVVEDDDTALPAGEPPPGGRVPRRAHDLG